MNLSQKNRSILAISASIVFYFLFAYFLDRTNFIQLTFQYVILFIPFWYFIKKEKDNFPLLGLTVVPLHGRQRPHP